MGGWGWRSGGGRSGGGRSGVGGQGWGSTLGTQAGAKGVMHDSLRQVSADAGLSL